MSSQSLTDLSGSEDFIPSDAPSDFSPGSGSFDSNYKQIFSHWVEVKATFPAGKWEIFNF